MGEAPIAYRDLQAWQELAGVELLPWEAAMMKRLSHSYLAMSQKAEALDCPAPYAGTVDDLRITRANVDAKIKAAFGSLKKAEA